ncbi:eCIS core domain-containing protein, partial [Paenibacillus alginolyticus]
EGYAMQKSHINRQPDSSLHTNKINKQNSSVSSDLMNIQRAIGNRAVGNMLTIQTKMTVGPAGDAYEQEADQMGKQAAEHIAASESSGASKPDVQRAEGGESEEEELQMKPSSESIQLSEGGESEEEELQMKSSSEGGFEAGAGIESQIKAKQGSGSRMDASIQAKMESAFNTDFSNVNIHNDSESSKINRSLGAEAFATGNDVFFREGRYNPDTREGQELLGHELTHVVQQRGGK